MGEGAEWAAARLCKTPLPSPLSPPEPLLLGRPNELGTLLFKTFLGFVPRYPNSVLPGTWS